MKTHLKGILILQLMLLSINSFAASTGDYRSIATGNWNNASTWERYNGTSWVSASTPTSTDGTIEIQSGHTITVTASVTADQIIVDAGGILVINSSRTLTIPNGAGDDLTVNGTLTINGTLLQNSSSEIIIAGTTVLSGTHTISAGAVSTVNSGGRYRRDGGTLTTTSGLWTINSGGIFQHNMNGGSLPLATWNTGASCEITGSTLTAPGNFNNQNFYSVTWDCPGQTLGFDMDLTVSNQMNGDFTVVSTGIGYFKFNGSTDGNYVIGGNFNIQGGKVVITGTATFVVNVTGNFSQTGGTFNFTETIATGNPSLLVWGNFSISAGTIDLTQSLSTLPASINIYGQYFSQTGGTITENSLTTLGKISFLHTGTQTYTKTGGTVSNEINFIIGSLTTLDLGTSIISSSGTFTNNNGSGMIIGSPDGITTTGALGNIQVSGTRTYKTIADYTYGGSSGQVTGNGLPATVRGLSINNSSNVTLTNSVIVSSTLTLSNGRFITGNKEISVSNTATGAVTSHSVNSYVLGNLRRSVTGTGVYDLPVGSASNYELATLNVSALTGVNNILAYFSVGTMGSVPSGLTQSGNAITDFLDYGYWTITPDASPSGGTYAVSLNSTGHTNAGSGVLRFVVKRPNGSNPWTAPGTYSNFTSPISGAVGARVTGLSSFSDFGVGEGVCTNPTDLTPTAQSSTICTGNTTNIQIASSQTGIDYQLRNNADNSLAGSALPGTGGTINLPTGILSTTMTYNVLATNPITACYAQMTNTVTVTVNLKSSDPTSATATATSICNGSSTVLTLNGGGGGTGEVIKWYTSSCGGTLAGTGNNLSVSPTSTTTYYGRYEDGSPCNYNSACASVTITVSNIPTTSIAGNDQNICGTSATLGSNVPSVGTGNWSIVTGSGSSFGDATSATSSFSGTGATSYTLRWTISSGACTPSTDDVDISLSAVPSATIAFIGSPFCFNQGNISVTRTGTPGGTYSSTLGLAINSSTGEVDIASSTPGPYMVTYTISASGPCPEFTTSAGITILSPGRWTGAVSSDWQVTGNWLCNTIPDATINVLIPSGLANYPTLSTGTGTVNNLSIESGSSLTVSGTTLQIVGTISNSGTFTSSSGTIEMNGTAGQSIPASTFAASTISNLTINNSAGVSLGGSLNLTGVLTLSDGLFSTGGNLTMKSTAAGTARVAPITSGTISGNVTVERYVPARRSWRMMTVPLRTTATIYSSWQNDGVYTAGHGMYVSGVNPDESNGLDASPLNKSSLKTFDTTIQNWTAVTNTKTSISGNSGSADNIPYFVFVRGDRTSSVFYTANCNTTTLSCTGLLQNGTQIFNATPTAGKFTLIGNPYASPVDFDKLYRTNLIKRFYAWDPGINEQGAYVVLDDLDGDGTYSKSLMGSVQTHEIQCGQAFLVETMTTAPAFIRFEEISKSTTNNTAVFRPISTPTSSFNANLYLHNSDGTTRLADGTLAQFNDDYGAEVDMMDAPKLGNINENLGFKRGSSLLSVERRPMTNGDTLFLSLNKTTQRDYQFEFISDNMNGGVEAFLEDNYLGSATPLALNGNSNRVKFNIGPAAGSASQNRFRIVFRPLVTLPLTLTNVKAYIKNDEIAIEWNTQNETNMDYYEVQKSSDGIRFSEINIVKASQNISPAGYSSVDLSPWQGLTYYRIKCINQGGGIVFSNVVKVINDKAQGGISIYPNPVNGGILNMQLIGMAHGKYNFNLINSGGQVVLAKKEFSVNGVHVSQSYVISNLAKGNYSLEVEGKHKKKIITGVIVQ